LWTGSTYFGFASLVSIRYGLTSRIFLGFSAFLHGDIAARADDPLGQSGTVVGVHLFLDVEFTSSKEKLYCVPAHQVAPIHPYQIGRYVVQGAWLGKIEGVRKYPQQQLPKLSSDCCGDSASAM
jgi:hypothetical protein